MHPASAVILAVLCVLLNAAPLPLVKDDTCALEPELKEKFEQFHKKHDISVLWDCGLENLAKNEFDRAADATERFPPSEASDYYLILTSKGMSLDQAFEKVIPLFFEEAKDFEPNTKYGCNTEKRITEQIFACLYLYPNEENSTP